MDQEIYSQLGVPGAREQRADIALKELLLVFLVLGILSVLYVFAICWRLVTRTARRQQIYEDQIIFEFRGAPLEKRKPDFNGSPTRQEPRSQDLGG